MKQKLSKIMVNIVKVFTCDPFPVVSKKTKEWKQRKTQWRC